MIRRAWRNDSIALDIAIIAIVVVLFCVPTAHYGWLDEIEATLEGNRSSIYTALTSVFGALLGFAITAVSVILGFGGSDSARLLRERGHSKTLWETFLAAIRVSGLATIVAFIGLILDRDTSPQPLLEILVLSVSLLAAIRLFRVVRRIAMLSDIF